MTGAQRIAPGRRPLHCGVSVPSYPLWVQFALSVHGVGYCNRTRVAGPSERRKSANYGLMLRSTHSMTASARVRSHITSRPTDGATDSIRANWSIPDAAARPRRTPLALRPEICLSSSSHFRSNCTRTSSSRWRCRNGATALDVVLCRLRARQSAA